MHVKINVTYNAGKLVKKLPKIIEKLSSDITDRAKVFYKKNVERGKDINNDNFKPLSPKTLQMKAKKQGYYKNATKNKTLIATGKMINGIKKINKDTLQIKGYGVYHNFKQKNTDKREWFGVSEFVLKNIIDNKKLKTFRKDISKAFKK